MSRPAAVERILFAQSLIVKHGDEHDEKSHGNRYGFKSRTADDTTELFIPCPRCDGEGGKSYWPRFTCFRCDGRRGEWIEEKTYDRRVAAREKAAAQRDAKHAAKYETLQHQREINWDEWALENRDFARRFSALPDSQPRDEILRYVLDKEAVYQTWDEMLSRVEAKTPPGEPQDVIEWNGLKLPVPIGISKVAIAKHPGPDNSEVHSTGTYQSAHGGTAFHGTSSHNITDLLKEGFELGRRGSGSAWGKGVYLAPSLEAAHKWANRTSEGGGDPVVVEVKVPKSFQVLTMKTSETLHGLRDAYRAHAGTLSDFPPSSSVPRDPNELIAQWETFTESSPEAAAFLAKFFADPRSQAHEGLRVAFTKQMRSAEFDAVEIIPVDDDRMRREYTGGHQLVIYNPDIFSSLKIKVVKGASQETWYLVLPRAVLTKHYPGQHDQKDHGNWAHPSDLVSQQSREETMLHRTYEERVALTESIRAKGVIEPLEVEIREDGRMYIVDGHQRHIIAANLGIDRVPIRVIHDFRKHYGPGPHPGTGTDQSAHGGGRGVSGLLDSPLRFAEERIEDGKPWYSLPPVKATFDSPEHALASFREAITYRQQLISQHPMPSDFGGVDAKTSSPYQMAYTSAFAIDEPTETGALREAYDKEAYVRYKSAKERWQTEMMGVDAYLSKAANEALPAVIRRGEDLGERIDLALDKREGPSEAPLDPIAVDDDPRIEALYEKSRLARNEAQRIYDEVYSMARDNSSHHYPDAKPVYLVPKEHVTRQVDARGKRQWENGGGGGGWGMTWEEYNTQYGVLTMKPAAFAGGIHSYDLGPQESSAYREYLEQLKVANPDLEIISSYDYTNLAAKAYRSRASSAERYESQRRALHEELSATRKLEGSNTEIIRDIIKSEIPLGGTLDTFNTKSKGARAVASNAELIPSKWIEASNTAGPLYVETLRSRAHYVNSSSLPRNAGTYGATLRISGQFDNDDILHEFGHRVEATNPDILFLERAFYESRTRGLEEVPLSSVLHSGYGPRERTIPDSFGHAYMGKRYRRDSDWGFRGTGTSSDRGWRYSTDEAYELLSMGLPRVYEKSRDPLDSESRAFILGLILEAGE